MVAGRDARFSWFPCGAFTMRVPRRIRSKSALGPIQAGNFRMRSRPEADAMLMMVASCRRLDDRSGSDDASDTTEGAVT